MNKPIRPAPANVPGPLIIRTPSWMDQAACLVPLPPEDPTPQELLDYQDALNAGFPHTKDEARDFIRDNCRRCWVQEECHAFAVATDVKHGVWGGQLFGRDDGNGMGS